LIQYSSHCIFLKHFKLPNGQRAQELPQRANQGIQTNAFSLNLQILNCNEITELNHRAGANEVNN